MNSTARMVSTPFSSAFSFSVANSSSASGTIPVNRTRAPISEARLRSVAICRTAFEAAPPGSSAVKSITGSTSMKRRSSRGSAVPLSRTRQEKLAKRPASTLSSVSDSMFIGRARSSRFMRPARAPPAPNETTFMTPRRLGSSDSMPISGRAAINWPMVRPTSSTGRNRKACCSKNAPPPGRRTERKCSVRPVMRCARASAARSVSSGVGPSTTTRIVWVRCGNARSSSTSRCRHGAEVEISWLVSVVMAKCRAA